MRALPLPLLLWSSMPNVATAFSTLSKKTVVSTAVSFDTSWLSHSAVVKTVPSAQQHPWRCSTTLYASSGKDQHHHNNNDDEMTSPSMNDVRKARLAKESSSSKRFALGEELKSLREDLVSLRHNLEWAKALKDEMRIQSLEKAIKNGQNRDPNFMYKKALRLIAEARKMKDASEEEKEALIEKWSAVASAAREVLPEFSMEGLWVGNYGGSHGTQLINITYSGDEMIATKCTGDNNVPRGEVTFTANLEPRNSSDLPPIQLISEHRKGEFRRFPGKGQVSRRGFKDHRYVEGQLILFENQFSFVWIPTKHHVLFHRPSPEMTLKLLRNTISKEDEIENMRDHISKCFNMDLSTAIARQQHAASIDEPLRRIPLQEDLEEAERRIKEANRGNIFYQMSKWRDYIDQVLDNKKL
ncbi:protein of unknown function DUF3506 containing protein [Nitzschia inconspicua]|uniref:Uncharacterized protein n=1 Tax=Nitzschia inconspicua TaxID=303405 RepID=A0A9K3L953_9STRA|nr:protein of unknown function DUF3506 containing protein [Nitzschia inconspicua]